ncbi:DUF1467 family protein [Phenylobacterium immobile]|uniref:DUF1467 family protein n=1 Tax=Phenylobacterium immobile TaxID=21 RepID=UPI000AE376F2|nr:DUF1467 family protein [Phenylobacterium immobile]
MGVLTGFAIYLTVWWTVLFVVLPLGTVTHAEADIRLTDGSDPGSPVNPNLKKKFITTTWVSALVWLMIWAVIHFHLINLSDLPWRS